MLILVVESCRDLPVLLCAFRKLMCESLLTAPHPPPPPPRAPPPPPPPHTHTHTHSHTHPTPPHTCAVTPHSYMFDEPSSYLDVKQRLKAAEAIRNLLSADMYVAIIVTSLHKDPLFLMVHCPQTLMYRSLFTWYC